MPVQYPPLTNQVGLPKDKSAKEQLFALMRILGQMPTPIGAESADAKAIAEWLAKNKGGPAVEEAVPKLLEKDPYVAEAAPEVAQKAPEGGGITMEALQKMAAQKPQGLVKPAEDARLAWTKEGGGVIPMSTGLKNSDTALNKLLKSGKAMWIDKNNQIINPPAMAAPSTEMGMEQAAAQAPKAAKAAKGGNKIAQQITELAGKTPSKQEVQAGLQNVGPDQMQQEFNALRELLDSARKLKAKGIESDIGRLYGDMMAGGGQRGPTSEATLKHVGMQRQLIQHQLQRLLDALAGKK